MGTIRPKSREIADQIFIGSDCDLSHSRVPAYKIGIQRNLKLVFSFERVFSMAVMLTDNAANQVKKFREEHQFGDEMFLRIGVAGGGCSGFNGSEPLSGWLVKATFRV